MLCIDGQIKQIFLD